MYTRRGCERIGKGEIIAQLYDRLSPKYPALTKALSRATVTTVLDLIKEHILSGEDVSLPDIGILQVRSRVGRRIANPQTKEHMRIRPRHSLHLKEALYMKTQLNRARDEAAKVEAHAETKVSG